VNASASPPSLLPFGTFYARHDQHNTATPSPF
jgi:hypothetical protein